MIKATTKFTLAVYSGTPSCNRVIGYITLLISKLQLQRHPESKNKINQQE